MSNAGNVPNFVAASTILPYSCVKSNTSNPFRAEAATAEADVVIGVTDGSTRAFDSVNQAIAGDVINLQNGEFLQMRAGGNIAIGDGLRPTTGGAVITATARTSFVAAEAAAINEIFWAKRVGAIEALGGGGAPGSPLGSVQFNNAGVFAGDAGLTYNSATDALTVAGDSFVNGVRVGKGNNSVAQNTAVGSEALGVVGDANRNTAVGYQAGYSINGGSDNTMVGRNAGRLLAGLASNGSGYDNTLIGANAGANLIAPTSNTGTTNTFIGSAAGLNVTTSSGSTIVGYIAGLNTTTGGENVFVGARAGRFNTTGNGNVAVGNDSLRGVSTALPFRGSASTAVGASALLNAMPSAIGDSNTAVGYQAGLDIRTGNYNVAIGNQALVSNLIGDANTAVGEYSGDGCKQSNNVYIGQLAAYRNWFGTGNVMIGQNAGGGNNSITNQKDEYPNRTPSTVTPSTSPYNASENTVVGFEAFKNPADTSNLGNPIIETVTMTQTPGSAIVVTKATHGLSTGNAVAFRSSSLNTAAQNPPGTTLDADLSLTLLPSPLFSGRTYYAIVVDANTYRLAESPDEASGSGFTPVNPILCTAATGAGTYSRVTVGTVTALGNTIMGYQAGLGAAGTGNQFSGVYNTLVGWKAGHEITTGGSNVCIGKLSGGILAGGGNVCIGKGAVVASASNVNSIVMGNDGAGFGSNTTSIGTTSTLGSRLYGVISTGIAAPTIASAATIAPVNPIVFVSGTTQIATITPPTGFTGGSGGQITIIPTGLFTTTITGGNIALASTAVVSKALIMTYDSATAKWYPSY